MNRLILVFLGLLLIGAPIHAGEETNPLTKPIVTYLEASGYKGSVQNNKIYFEKDDKHYQMNILKNGKYFYYEIFSTVASVQPTNHNLYLMEGIAYYIQKRQQMTKIHIYDVTKDGTATLKGGHEDGIVAIQADAYVENIALSLKDVPELMPMYITLIENARMIYREKLRTEQLF